MKPWKSLSLLGLAVLLAVIILGCGSNARPPISITTTTLSNATIGVAYNATLNATGGRAPYTWSLSSGALPAGLALSSGGVISGTPTTAGTSNFAVQVADSQAVPSTASAQFSITVTPPPVNISGTPPAGEVNVAYSYTLSASGGVPPYTWSMASGTLPPGLTLSASGVIGGTPTTAGTSTFTVQVADSQATADTATAQMSITVNGNPNAALKGNYAFLVQGSGPNGQTASIGEFEADGNGNITSGEIFENSRNGQPLSSTCTGTYSIEANGLGTLTFTSPAQTSTQYTSTWSFALGADGNGYIIRYDDVDGTGTRGSGVLRKQDTSAFDLSKFNGDYVYGYNGADLAGGRLVQVGVFNLDGLGNLVGSGDGNDAGTVDSISLSGVYAPIDYTTGRAAAAVDSGDGPVNYYVYVVSTSEMLIMSWDPVSQAQFLLAGNIYQQTGNGSFDVGSLNGKGVLYATALGRYQDQYYGIAVAGLVAADGLGNLTVDAWENDGGNFSNRQGGGTYSVESNGRITFTGDIFPPIAYLIDTTRGVGIGTNEAAGLGYVQIQAGGPFSEASISGTYVAGSTPPVNEFAGNTIGQGTGDGLGSLGGPSNNSNSIGLQSGFVYTIDVSVEPSGFVTAHWNGGFVGYIYLLSPTKLVAVTWEDSPRIILFEH